MINYKLIVINMSGNFLFVKLLLFNIKIFCNLIFLYQT